MESNRPNRPPARGYRAYVPQVAPKRIGFLINFNVPVLKGGIRRYIWRENKELTTERTEAHRENGDALAKTTHAR